MYNVIHKIRASKNSGCFWKFTEMPSSPCNDGPEQMFVLTVKFSLK